MRCGGEQGGAERIWIDWIWIGWIWAGLARAGPRRRILTRNQHVTAKPAFGANGHQGAGGGDP